jgi:hypothetical protein
MEKQTLDKLAVALKAVEKDLSERVTELAAKSKSAMRAGLPAFDFPFDKLRVRSGRTGMAPTVGEEVYQSYVA